jgi:uncharacterized protein
MPVTYASPGVYVEEVDRGTKPIQGVGTSMPAFVGVTARAARLVVEGDKMIFAAQTNTGKPVLVANWSQFVQEFGGFSDGAYLPDAVFNYFANGGGSCYVVSLAGVQGAPTAGATAMAAWVEVPGAGRNKSFRVEARQPGALHNGLVVTVTPGENDTFSLQIGDELRSGLTTKADDPNALAHAAFEQVIISLLGPQPPKPGSYVLAEGRDAASPQARLPDLADYMGDTELRTGFAALESIDELRLLVCPDAMLGYDGSDKAKERVKLIQKAMIDYCEKVRYCFAILDAPPGLSAQQAREWRLQLGFDSSHAALYYPWVEVADLSDNGSQKKLIPPSGCMAGVYNRVDAERGIHKAPANDVLRGVIGLERQISRAEQDVLNPIGVNCIRSFPTHGIRAWGARTLSSNGAWRYVNVRRLFIFVEASLEEGLQWVVFEPNDNVLWGKVRRDVTAFLTQVWRSGALFGPTADQAFYVKCDAELNPPEVRDMGQLIIEVGLAPVKPAEFVIVRISQWAGADAQAA